MRLLFNNNLSHRLIAELADIYPDSPHVRNIGPEDAEDAVDTDIWDYARDYGLVIDTKDRDYREMSRVRGTPSEGRTHHAEELPDHQSSSPASPTSGRPHLTATGEPQKSA